MILSQGYCILKDGQSKLFRDFFLWVKDFSSQEVGYLGYKLEFDQKSPNKILIFEEWKDLDAFDHHFNQWYFREFYFGIQGLLEKPFEIKIFEIKNSSKC
jgi:quinol monooxygenase YgiN